MTTSLTIEQAKAITERALDAGLLQPPLPTTQEEYFTVAVHILKSCANAIGAGHQLPALKEIVKLSEPNADLTPPTPAVTNKEAATATHTDVPPTEVPAEMGLSIEESKKLIAAVEDTAAASTDATPLESDQEKESSTPTSFTPTVVPRDFSLISDPALRSLHSTLHSDFALLMHELGLEESDYASAKENLESVKRIAEANAEGEKVTDRRVAAATTPEALDWQEKVTKHHRQCILLRHARDIIDKQISGVSREGSMREAERKYTAK